jgi:hypothetical protein
VLGNFVEPLGDTDNLGRQWRFVILATDEGKTRSLLKRKAQRHMTLAAGFSQLNESEGRDVDRSTITSSCRTCSYLLKYLVSDGYATACMEDQRETHYVHRA